MAVAAVECPASIVAKIPFDDRFVPLPDIPALVKRAIWAIGRLARVGSDLNGVVCRVKDFLARRHSPFSKDSFSIRFPSSPLVRSAGLLAFHQESKLKELRDLVRGLPESEYLSSRFTVKLADRLLLWDGKKDILLIFDKGDSGSPSFIVHSRKTLQRWVGIDEQLALNPQDAMTSGTELYKRHIEKSVLDMVQQQGRDFSEEEVRKFVEAMQKDSSASSCAGEHCAEIFRTMKDVDFETHWLAILIRVPVQFERWSIVEMRAVKRWLSADSSRVVVPSHLRRRWGVRTFVRGIYRLLRANAVKLHAERVNQLTHFLEQQRRIMQPAWETAKMKVVDVEIEESSASAVGCRGVVWLEANVPCGMPKQLLPHISTKGLCEARLHIRRRGSMASEGCALARSRSLPCCRKDGQAVL